MFFLPMIPQERGTGYPARGSAATQAMTTITLPPLFTSLPDAVRHGVTHLFFDIDDTVTHEGALPEPAAVSLYRAAAQGLHLVAVTGRSAAWAELLLRLFPLKAAVAETGALCLVKSHGGRLEVLHSESSEEVRRVNTTRRTAAVDRVLREVPGARLALDNVGRLYDTAFDLVEDGPLVDDSTSAHIRSILQHEGLEVAQSSVHINAWFGRFDKATMVERYLRECCSTSLVELGDRLVYAGDSKNDGPMFAAAGLSVGVANVKPHLPWLTERGQAPRYVVNAPGGHGFAELVALLTGGR
ncbi:MAG: HAD-IIB family hydrolase [Myxococcota bacterium]